MEAAYNSALNISTPLPSTDTIKLEPTNLITHFPDLELERKRQYLDLWRSVRKRILVLSQNNEHNIVFFGPLTEYQTQKVNFYSKLISDVQDELESVFGEQSLVN